MTVRSAPRSKTGKLCAGSSDRSHLSLGCVGVRAPRRMTGSQQGKTSGVPTCLRNACGSFQLAMSSLPQQCTFKAQTAGGKFSSGHGVKRLPHLVLHPHQIAVLADDSVENIFLCFFLRPDASPTKPPVLPRRRGNNGAVVPLIASGVNVNLPSQEASLSHYYSPEVYIYI